MNQDELEKIKKNAWEIYSINNKDISLDYEDFSYGFYSGAEALQKELYVQQKEVDEWKYNYEAEIPRQVMMLEANKKIQKELDEAVDLLDLVYPIAIYLKNKSYTDKDEIRFLWCADWQNKYKEFLVKVKKE